MVGGSHSCDDQIVDRDAAPIVREKSHFNATVVGEVEVRVVTGLFRHGTNSRKIVHR